MNLLSRFRNLFSDNTNEQLGPPKPEYSAPIIAFNGGPGGGKTTDMTRIAMFAGYHYGLPLVVQDTKGEITRYIDITIDSLKKRKVKEYKDKIGYLENKVAISTRPDGREFVKTVREMNARYKGSKHMAPTTFFVVDEGGTLQFENGGTFWQIASTMRNIGATCFVTLHRERGDGGFVPLARQCTRAVVLYSQYEETEWWGVKVQPNQVTKPMHEHKVFITNSAMELQSFNMPPLDMDIDEGTIPEVLMHPVNTSDMKSLVF